VNDRHLDATAEEDLDLADEVLSEDDADWLPVISEDVATPTRAASGAQLEVAAPRPLQTVAVAAGGFVAGMAAVSLVHRRRRRRAARRVRRGASGPVGELVQIVGSRSLLVDVHLLGGRD
jgi:hypothetical protein